MYYNVFDLPANIETLAPHLVLIGLGIILTVVALVCSNKID